MLIYLFFKLLKFLKYSIFSEPVQLELSLIVCLRNTRINVSASAAKIILWFKYRKSWLSQADFYLKPFN